MEIRVQPSIPSFLLLPNFEFLAAAGVFEKISICGKVLLEKQRGGCNKDILVAVYTIIGNSLGFWYASL